VAGILVTDVPRDINAIEVVVTVGKDMRVIMGNINLITTNRRKL
jgi:hypothetical protein